MTQPLVIAGRIKLRRFDPGYCGEIDKQAAKKETKRYRKRIDELQRKLYANSKQTVLLVFQGMDASGKDGAIRSVLQRVNPAGVENTNFKEPSAEEKAHDFLWRIHRAIPRYGYLGTFNRSHYEGVLVERVRKLVPREVWLRRYDEIVEFERFLVANNVVLLKFCLHISRAEQARRFEERLSNPHKYWKFSQSDLATRQHWDDYEGAYEDMLNRTSHPEARWHLVPADHNWYRDFVIARAVATALEDLRLKWPKAAKDLSKIKIK
jgi:PPK2 family polyphosphate:nucleotide phosphotransferase